MVTPALVGKTKDVNPQIISFVDFSFCKQICECTFSTKPANYTNFMLEPHVFKALFLDGTLVIFFAGRG